MANLHLAASHWPKAGGSNACTGLRSGKRVFRIWRPSALSFTRQRLPSVRMFRWATGAISVAEVFLPKLRFPSLATWACPLWYFTKTLLSLKNVRGKESPIRPTAAAFTNTVTVTTAGLLATPVILLRLEPPAPLVSS